MKALTLIGAVATTLVLAGCKHECDCRDIMFDFDVPRSQADCPANTEFKQLEMFSSDRDGGAKIKDRQGKDVVDVCYRSCKSGEIPVNKPVVWWHQSSTSGVIVVQDECVPGPPE